MKWVIAIFAAVPLAATAGTFTPPKGCTAYLTVQMSNCKAEHHWTCAGDPEGEHWALTIDVDGPRYLQHLDREFRWLKKYPIPSNFTRTLQQPEADPNSLTELLETGRDDFDFEQTVLRGDEPITSEHITGFDKLTGTKVRIDGEELLVTEFEFRVETRLDGEMSRTYGNQYVSPKFRLFFQGRETEEVGGETYHYDEKPVLFVEPGEAGFLAGKPKFGCDQMMSGLQMPLATEKERRDEL